VSRDAGDSGVSALLPLKVSGRHYGENLARLDLLFSSLSHYAAPGLLDELVIVVREDELEPITAHLGRWPELPIRIVVEEEHFAVFRRFRRPWQIYPWHRQQIIKLNAPALTRSAFVLTFDPDVIAVKPVTRDLLLPQGKALLDPVPRSLHPEWWHDSADLLDVEPDLERPGMNVTPALLSTEILEEVHRRLEAVGGRPWMEILLTSYCTWTEYSLYMLAAERAELLDRLHIWANDPRAGAWLQVDPRVSIWYANGASGTDVERLFSSEIPGLFAVVQSAAGLTASEVAAVAGEHFAVPSAPAEHVPTSPQDSWIRERFRRASRLAACWLSKARRRTRRSRRPVPR
jgi:Family of unknown function (DUF6492)